MPFSNIPSNEFLLSVSSQNGAVSNFVMSSACVGICNSAAKFSSLFVGDVLETDITASFYLPLPIGSHIKFLFTGFELASSASLVVHIGFNLTGIASSPTFHTILNGSNFVVSTPMLIPAKTTFFVAIRGLQFSDTLKTIVPTLSLSIPAPTNNFVQSILVPPLFENPKFLHSGLSLTGVRPGDLTTVSWNFESGNYTIGAGSFAVLLLNGFTNAINSKIQFEGNLPFIDHQHSTWDPLASTMTIRFIQDVDSATVVNVSFSGLSLPLSGVASNLLPNILGYAVGIQNSQSSFRLFDTNTQIFSVLNLQVSFDYSSILELHSLSLSFTSNGGLKSGDVISLYLQDFQQQSQVGALTTIPVAHQVAWNPLTHFLSITLASTVSAGNVVLTVNTSIALTLPANGINARSASSPMSISRLAKIFAMANTVLPCIGICSASMIPFVTKAGYSTNYAVAVTFGAIQFSSSSVLQLHLVGFSNTDKAYFNCSNDPTTSFGGSNLQLNWDSSTSMLSVSVAQCTLPVFVPTSSLNFEIK